MMLEIPRLLTPEQVGRCRQVLQQAPWVDGRSTAGLDARGAKHNLQLPADSREGAELGQLITGAMGRNALFVAATLPLRILPPMFNCYPGGGSYGAHIDNAIHPLGRETLRGDVSCTVFLSDPDEYDGGELTVQDSYGEHAARLPAGHALVYPASSLHHVTPVTRGARLAAICWVQSLVRSGEQRAILLELDEAIQQLRASPGLDGTPPVLRLTGVYHNLLRQWAQT